MNTTTITFTSLSLFKKYLRKLQNEKVTDLHFKESYPYTITFNTKTTRRTNNLFKRLHLSFIQPTDYALAA